MFKFERMFTHLYKTKSVYKLVPLSSKYFATKEIISASNESENINENKDDPQKKILEISNFDNLVADSEITPQKKSVKDTEEVPFATLLRQSNLMNLGDPEGKVVIGKVFEVVNNDLYIDFGWKFHCVCPKPVKNNSDYVRGAKVRLRIKDLELSTKFLGSTKDTTLLEADCVLLGLISTPNRISKTADSFSASANVTPTTINK